MLKRDGANISIWQPLEAALATHTFPENDTFDVVIVGGGITGISTALQLQNSGKRCILIEAETIGFGTTGGTTAHLNTFFDEPYYRVAKNFGQDNAQLLARGAAEAMEAIHRNVAEFNLKCNLETKEAFLLATDDKQADELEKIVSSAEEVGVTFTYVQEHVAGISYVKAAKITGQAQFHPLKYVFGLADALEAAGGKVVQHCRMIDFKEDDEHVEIETTLGKLRAKHLVFATHTSPGLNMLHFRCAPYRSYAMAFEAPESFPDVLVYDLCEPYHYIRRQTAEGKNFLIIGGEDHKTGHEANTDACFTRLEATFRDTLQLGEAKYKWSSQYYEPVDGLPFIGRLPGKDHIFVAAAFSGNGMIYGTLSARIISDLIIKNESPYERLFEPKRIKPIASMGRFLKENLDVAKEFIKGKLSHEKLSGYADLAPGEAKIVTIDGHAVALYKDEMQGLKALNPTCPHAHCSVAWNAGERSWDCPCHGARFDPDGKLLNGPAQSNLEQIDLEESGDEN